MTQNAGKFSQHISGAYLCTRARTSSNGGIKDSGQEFKLFVARWQPDTVIITPRSYNSGIPLMSAPINTMGLTDGSRAFKLPLVSLMKSRASAIQMHLWMKRSHSSGFESQLFTTYQVLKSFSLYLQRVTDLIDLSSALNFTAKLKQWPLRSELYGEVLGSWVHNPRMKSKAVLFPPLSHFLFNLKFLFLTALGLVVASGLSLVAGHSHSCPRACGIFSDRGSNLCPLLRQVDS